MATWPSDVPFFKVLPSISGSGPVGAVLRTQMDAGPAKVRRLFTAAPREFSAVTPPMTAAQFADFDTFYTDTLKMGTLSFTATDPRDCTDKTFRFVDGFNDRMAGKKRQVTAQLEILP